MLAPNKKTAPSRGWGATSNSNTPDQSVQLALSMRRRLYDAFRREDPDNQPPFPRDPDEFGTADGCVFLFFLPDLKSRKLDPDDIAITFISMRRHKPSCTLEEIRQSMTEGGPDRLWK